MKILVAIDDSLCSRAALDFVRDMAPRAVSSVVILSAVRVPVMAYSEAFPSVSVMEEMVKEQREAREELVSRAELDFLHMGLATKARVVEDDPQHAIVEAAKQENVDMIVIGSHGRSGIAKLVLGSVAAHVVAHAPCSVLVVKAPVRSRARAPLHDDI